MEEALRRQYLAAMGIQGWALRQRQTLDQAASYPGEETVGNARDPVAQPPGSAQGVPNRHAELSDKAEAEPGVAVDPAEQASSSLPAAGSQETADLDWPSLRQRVLSCTACGLSETRTQAVFGVGNREADLLVVGEAPGADEDREGEPFVGRAGQLLNAMLKGIGLRRDQVYIANILKCRPPGNRDPRPEEALRCEAFLLRQVELIKPRLILAVGRISAQHLLQTDTPVGRLRGRVHEFGDNRIPLVVTYHPAYLLRSPEQKARAWQDLLLVLANLGDKDNRN